jgi:hypothetical protein
MPDQNTVLAPRTEGDWRPRVLILGGLVGAAIGLLSAYLYVRAADENVTGKQPEAPGTGDAVRLGISLLAIVRTITEWAKH